MADATDLKSVDPKGSCGFESRHRHIPYVLEIKSLSLAILGFLTILTLAAMCGSQQGIDHLLTALRGSVLWDFGIWKSLDI
jgi:hypothetical protein